MANTTDEYWSYAGVSLQTYAYNIQSIGEDRNGVPGVRGSNLTVPFRGGGIFMPKNVEERVISLGMWVQGSKLDGSPSDRSSEEEFDKNWARLRKLFWGNPKMQFPLSKTVAYWDSTGKRVPVRVTAMASFAGGLRPTMTGRNRGRFVVDLLLTDPWFYPDVPLEKTFNTSTSWSIPAEVMGDAPTDRIEVTFTGTSVYRPSLRLLPNPEYPDGANFTFEATLGGESVGNSVTFYIQDWYARDNTKNRAAVGSVYHSGSTPWIELGTLYPQTIAATREGNALTVQMKVWPRYF